jgi:protein phosphatase
MLVDEGAITAEEASHHPHRSLVTQVLQGQPIEPNYSIREAIRGDRYLLCSDGLSNVVSMDTMGDVLREYRDPDACAERLIDLALRAGGPDNITAIVADIVESDPGQASEAPVSHRADAPAGRRPSPRPRPPQAPPGPAASPGAQRQPTASASEAPVAAPEDRDGGSAGAGAPPTRPSLLATHRLTVVLVLALATILTAVGIWYTRAG